MQKESLFDNDKILKIAAEQSAIDLNCRPEDFFALETRYAVSEKNRGARTYLDLPFELNFCSYGANVVVSGKEEVLAAVKPIVEKTASHYRLFETPNMRLADEAVQRFGCKICFMAEYFLPDANRLSALPCDYEIRVLEPIDFSGLYGETWSNALCSERKQHDALACGAYDGEKLVGLAGASADSDTMWQIGVDVLPEYRRRGIASALTSRLALACFERGKVPFYCAAWSNLRSVRNALKSGFRPAWVEMTAKPAEFVDKLNEIK